MLAVLLVGGAVLIGLSRRDELFDAFHQLARVHWPKLAVALLCEAWSLLCLAAVQRWLLLAGGLRVGRGTINSLNLASNAVAGALPGGAAFSAAWMYRELRRRGGEQALVAAVLVVSGALSAVTLVVELAVGALLAGAGGPGQPLRRVLVGLAATLLVTLLIFRSTRVRRGVVRRWRRLRDRHRRIGRASAALARVVHQARSVEPGIKPWLWPYLLAQLNWLLDAASLAACLWALDIAVPWRGLLLVSGLGQIPASTRITPGGLGVTETSLAALLVFYGIHSDEAIAATLLYRIVSYWLLQPLGWACWLALTLHGRRGSR
ncbi:UPF0104 family protein [Streptomyces hoynatensis]|uniref:UPF0104 family protein n=1 Tax=Streptomyces hoynatensis TaxID=1141874 RepID=A0A3A9Z0D2_9ACTN|nr:UPF0104 family protein [Streptomyces hoynatensis]